uniref:PP2C family serine/threonine-protein phosphatase n=2 Tax=Flavobacterium sp. TaxID=239 RepID=UPI0040498145
MYKNYILKLLAANQIDIPQNKSNAFEDFVLDETMIHCVQLILENQQKIMANWQLKTTILDILQEAIQIPNGIVGKPYEAKMDFTKPNWKEIIFSDIIGLEETGLKYDNETEIISGNPIQNGEFKLRFLFRVQGEAEDSTLHEKKINLILNANPRSLWKDIESDQTDRFWKEDNVHVFEKLGDKNIVVASKRGRSHANVGSFRDDDFAFKHFDNTGWSVVAVSDGAGSAKNARKGSEIACHETINYFETNLNEALSAQFDLLINNYYKEINHLTIDENPVSTSVDDSKNVHNNTASEHNIESSQQQIGKLIYNTLGGCAKHIYNKLDEFANQNAFSIKDLHSTLIFSLFKKYDFGYVILSFGVGDCPIAVIHKDQSAFKLMNWLDVGEFGGGTRFITMPEIFTSEKFSTRFGFKIIDDFSYLILMTDGIYDAKFVVEANLEKLEKWHAFLDDLDGNNEDKTQVVFDKSNDAIANQLSTWMDFWSPGNHDDRTLAIVF